MIERGVDDSIGLLGAGAKAVGVLQIAAMDLRAGGFELSRASVGPRQAEHLVSGREQFGNDARADEAGRTSEEYAHGTAFRYCSAHYVGLFFIL